MSIHWLWNAMSPCHGTGEMQHATAVDSERLSQSQWQASLLLKCPRLVFIIHSVREIYCCFWPNICTLLKSHCLFNYLQSRVQTHTTETSHFSQPPGPTSGPRCHIFSAAFPSPLSLATFASLGQGDGPIIQWWTDEPLGYVGIHIPQASFQQGAAIQTWKFRIFHDCHWSAANQTHKNQSNIKLNDIRIVWHVLPPMSNWHCYQSY